jgi:hypothetical protein
MLLPEGFENPLMSKPKRDYNRVCPSPPSGPGRAICGIYPDASSGIPRLRKAFAEFIPQLCAGGFPLLFFTQHWTFCNPCYCGTTFNSQLFSGQRTESSVI